MRSALLPVVVAVVGLGAAGLAALPSQAPENPASVPEAGAGESPAARKGPDAAGGGRHTIPLPLPEPASGTPADPPHAETVVANAPPQIRATGRSPAANPEDRFPGGTDPVPAAAPVEATAGAAETADDAAVAQPAEPPGRHVSLEVRSGDSLDRLFRRHDISTVDLAYIMKLDEAARHLKTIRPGDRIDVRHADGEVMELSRAIGDLSSLRVERQEDGFRAQIFERQPEIRIRRAHGTITTSLYEAGVDAGLTDTTIMNLASIFAWDVDFALDIRKGDGFSVVYEERWVDGQRLRDGNVLAAEFQNQGDVFRALRYAIDEDRSEYFTPEGNSLRKAFLRAPVDFRRVSSNFNMARLHPVLKVRRPHRGVDYAARSGTPIKAAGDGKIIHRGRKGGYGNTVIIQHGGNITTLYAHMSKYARGQRVGSRVRQGQVIGYVGQSGLASGPHLHYEYRVNGVHRNPRTVKLPEANPVDPALREDFLQATAPLVAELDALNQIRLAQAN